MTHTEILTRALELLAVSTFYNPELQAKRTDVIEKGLEALAQPEQEPVALKWQRAPIRTAWGDEMVVASVAIDKDHTVCLYCERDQTPKVDAMFAQRTEQNFCPRCGKRTKDIHTCTPPRENT